LPANHAFPFFLGESFISPYHLNIELESPPPENGMENALEKGKTFVRLSILQPGYWMTPRRNENGRERI
jgi:hypothetical protein